jgi:hypothetical protein
MKKYDFVGKYYNGFARVVLNDKYGFINKHGVEICEIKYDMVWYFIKNECAGVKLNNKFGFIDHNGKEICPIKYDWTTAFENGIFQVKLNNKYGVINERGQVII